MKSCDSNALLCNENLSNHWGNGTRRLRNNQRKTNKKGKIDLLSHIQTSLLDFFVEVVN